MPHPLPPRDPVLAPQSFVEPNRVAELVLARLSGVSGLVPSVDWLLYSAVRKDWYPPDQQDAAVELVLRQAEALAAEMVD